MTAGRRRGAGFTLIELMVTIAILAVVVSIALPSYRSHVLRSQRSDAMATLATYQAILERCYAQTYAYNATSCTAVPIFPQTSPQGYYTINAVLAASTYTLTAAANPGQADDTACATMTVNQANVRTPAGTCWNP